MGRARCRVVSRAVARREDVVSQTVSGRVMPIIAVGSVDDVRNFYVDKLGFEHVMGMVGKDGQLDFCTVVLGQARVMSSARLQQRQELAKESRTHVLAVRLMWWRARRSIAALVGRLRRARRV